MKHFLLTILAVLLWLPAAHADRYTDLAQHSLDWLRTSQGDSLLAHCSPKVKAALTPAMVNQLWTQLCLQAGELKEAQPWQAQQLQGMEVRSRLLVFERAALRYVVVQGAEGLIEGMNFAPAPMPEKASAPADTAVAALPAGVAERPFAVTHGRISLPGTLTLPAAADGPVPVVVLVHGSGPGDRDESLGPNKPFRELAIALARRGIATLRYDKRTYVYKERTLDVSDWKLTYRTETVDDAQQAVRLVAKLPEVDARRIFVLGHSLGGTLLPLIAEGCKPKPAGLIGLAAMARPFWEAVHDQLQYIYGAENDSLVRAAERQMLASLPEEYLDFQAKYDPLKEARKLGQLPMLFVQGGHDYQVTETDLHLWRQALKGNKRARFCLLPTLDHLMRSLPTRAVPADYQRLLPVDEAAVEAVADFVLHGAQ